MEQEKPWSGKKWRVISRGLYIIQPLQLKSTILRLVMIARVVEKSSINPKNVPAAFRQLNGIACNTSLTVFNLTG
jgi:hypothetical protein